VSPVLLPEFELAVTSPVESTLVEPVAAEVASDDAPEVDDPPLDELPALAESDPDPSELEPSLDDDPLADPLADALALVICPDADPDALAPRVSELPSEQAAAATRIRERDEARRVIIDAAYTSRKDPATASKAPESRRELSVVPTTKPLSHVASPPHSAPLRRAGAVAVEPHTHPASCTRKRTRSVVVTSPFSARRPSTTGSAWKRPDARISAARRIVSVLPIVTSSRRMI